MARVGEEIGLNVVYEAFPDRAYTPEGMLRDRNLLFVKESIGKPQS
ncbi:MAG: hypothetical protein B6230_01195 [Desulfobacteraceae bacterium 4572_89]|nr:MAG: hypothetical protein B6230_01195 [Desulfobacteraceae bacterium 4572_89]